MPSLEKSEAATLHAEIIENTYLAAVFLGRVGRSLNVHGESGLKECTKALQNKLVETYRGKEVEYADYQDLAKSVQQVALSVWNPTIQGSTKDIASLTNTLYRAAWMLANEPESFSSVIDEIPNMSRQMEKEREKIAQIDAQQLTPFERLIFEGELLAIGEAMDAANNLPTLRQDASPENVRSLAKLNVEFVSEPALSAWLTSLSVSEALPASSDMIMEALDDVEKYKHARPETKEILTGAWLNERPELGEHAIQATVNALLGSACSTKMDTLQKSSADVVRAYIESTYKERLTLSQLNETGAANKDQLPLSELASSLEVLSRRLDHAESRLPSGVTATMIEDIQRQIARVSAKVGVLVDGTDIAPEGEGPGQ